ncbi:aldehyde dehydrogenase family protein [Novosphingobium resinovorum]|uniref:aldehyde dehydrogenase family protein n=1 Tax=Novosphingobium resinovorum TaxID=158500 RepID=UPI003D27585B
MCWGRGFRAAGDQGRSPRRHGKLLANVKIGPASDPATQLGPVISAAQRDRCAHFTQAAVEAGGRVVCGGKRPEGYRQGLLLGANGARPAGQFQPRRAGGDLRAGGRRDRLP